MNPSEYRVGCERTVCDHNRALQRLQEISPNNPTFGLRLLHAAMGMSKESGEVQDLLEKAIFFNQELNVEKILDELGDILWYMSLALNTIGQSFEEVMRRNDAKLKARFPSKYQDELAKNRDRAKEEKAQSMGHWKSIADTVKKPEEVTETEAHCNHNWTMTNYGMTKNHLYCTKCNLAKP
jgi:NTP pyrophosphatase (non-canonical NTP hydrolase)